MIEKLKERVREGNYRFTMHGLERCIERDISPNEVSESCYTIRRYHRGLSEGQIRELAALFVVLQEKTEHCMCSVL